MNYYTIVEPAVREKYWNGQYTQGIVREVERAKGKYVEVALEGLPAVRNACEKAGLRPVVLVNGVAENWISGCLCELNKAGLHPLFLMPIDNITGNVSGMSLDFHNATIQLCQYLEKSGRENIALFALNHYAVNDAVKLASFKKYYEAKGLTGGEHVFFNNGDLEDCCNAFYEKVHAYDAVVCSNDISAIKLVRFLKKRDILVPKHLYVAPWAIWL